MTEHEFSTLEIGRLVKRQWKCLCLNCNNSEAFALHVIGDFSLSENPLYTSRYSRDIKVLYTTCKTLNGKTYKINISTCHRFDVAD